MRVRLVFAERPRVSLASQQEYIAGYLEGRLGRWKVSQDLLGQFGESHDLPTSLVYVQSVFNSSRIRCVWSEESGTFTKGWGSMWGEMPFGPEA